MRSHVELAAFSGPSGSHSDSASDAARAASASSWAWFALARLLLLGRAGSPGLKQTVSTVHGYRTAKLPSTMGKFASAPTSSSSRRDSARSNLALGIRNSGVSARRNSTTKRTAFSFCCSRVASSSSFSSSSSLSSWGCCCCGLRTRRVDRLGVGGAASARASSRETKSWHSGSDTSATTPQTLRATFATTDRHFCFFSGSSYWTSSTSQAKAPWPPRDTSRRSVGSTRHGGPASPRASAPTSTTCAA
mmetsp:Transcript_33084/g.105596  ORF Transcript_33084/g.105596 Transcript_33084/m.105596 type:complete len:248 (-) Transcript_33084:445-1188(-)